MERKIIVSKDTIYVKNDILSKKDEMDVLQYIKDNEELFISWKRYINRCVEMRGCSYEKFAALTGFSKNTIKSWCKEGVMPKNRDMFIKLAFGLGLSIEQTNELLVKYGRYSELYAKDLYDAIIIYLLNKRKEHPDNPHYSFDAVSEWVSKFKEIHASHIVDNKYYNRYKTIGVFNSIAEIEEDIDFEKFILENKGIFLSSYSGLLLFIDTFINIRKADLDRENDLDGKERYSWHKMVIEKGLDQSFDKMIAELRTRGIVPKRSQLIALGIHLNMVESDINKMLSLAHMQELYARDRAEALLMYVLRNAVIKDPDLEFNNASRYNSYSSIRLFKEDYQRIIDSYYERADEMPDWDEGIACLADYVRERLSNIELSEWFDQII